MSNLKDNWSFHIHIAIPLESISKKILGLTIETVFNSMFSAGSIENSEFAKVMIFLVRKAPKYNCDKLIDNFVIKCSEYVGKNGNEIDRNISHELFEEFVNLIEY